MATASQDAQNPALLHALAYAGAGLAVLPLVSGGKVPLCRNGLHDATTDPDVIRGWWGQNPLANIGVRPPRGVVVLDVDPRSGGTLEALGPLPVTWTARTGGGGWHIWFQFPGPVRGKLDRAPGVDIKSNSGYVVVPPSVHPSGRNYEWLNNARIASLPSHLSERVRVPPIRRWMSSSVAVGSCDGLVRFVATAQPGERNRCLFWAACRAFESGGDPVLLAQLADAASAVGLSGMEIERTVRSAERRCA
jgi:hypothetical protein